MVPRSLARSLAALALLLSACQPLPHPFADDVPPPGALLLPDSVGVTVAPVDGMPKATAEKLAAAMAAALLERDIPASARTASLGSYALYGRISEFPASGPASEPVTMVAIWRLRDVKDDVVGERVDKVVAPRAAWATGADDVVKRLAAAGAPQIADLLGQGRSAAEVAGAGKLRLEVRRITGAPGDGSQSLALAIGTALKGQDIDVLAAGAARPDLYLDAAVTVGPAENAKQHVKIVWKVRRADDSEIGEVSEENDVPAGLLNDAWGDVAYSVALSAEDGILRIIARGAPSPQGPPAAAPPQSAKPQSAEPESAKPQSATPESAKPQSAEPQSAKPESTEPEASEPAASAPKDAAPDQKPPEKPLFILPLDPS